MALKWGAQYPKLKTNLRLAVNRLKLLEKKKTELALKSRTEISDFIANHKEDRARIRVEHIIREDFLVEAYELLEMYCDLLLARFGLIEQVKQLDDGIAEAVISLLWAAPRLVTDVAEFRVISDQLTLKYGKALAEAARSNQLDYPAKVSPKLIAKMSVQTPPKLLVEKYMIEIAKTAGIPFTPDANVMREDEIAAAEQMLIDFRNQGGQGYGWMYPENDVSCNKPNDAGGGSFPPHVGPDQNDNSPSSGVQPPPPHSGSHFPSNFKNHGTGIDASFSTETVIPPSYPSLSQIGFPSDDIVKIRPADMPDAPSAPPARPSPLNDTAEHTNIPNFPEPPTDIPGSLISSYSPKINRKDADDIKDGSVESLDFEDLAKRFDMLKKKRGK